MMNEQQFLFTMAAEEAVEVAHRAHKAVRFTASEIQPGQHLTNADRLVVEYIELTAIMKMLEAKGHLQLPPDSVVDKIMVDKEARVEQFAKLSRMLGQIE